MKISVYCSECFERIALPPAATMREGEVRCAKGHAPLAFTHSDAVREERGPDRCSRCAKTAFFVQRDFDQRLGCLILCLGIFWAGLVSWKKGGIWFVPVLLLVAGVDLLVARAVGHVVICYRCDTEYRGIAEASRRFEPYDPHIAERDAEVKTVRRINP